MALFTRLSWFYAKQMGKSILYMGTYTFLLIMLMMRFLIRQYDSFGKTDYGNFVGEMTLIVQATMLLFMVFFTSCSLMNTDLAPIFCLPVHCASQR